MHIQFKNQADAIPALFRKRLVDWGQGTLMITTGNTTDRIGVGKTENTAALFDRVDKDFNIDKIATVPRDFLKGLDEIENNGKPGQCEMMDECQISASAINFMSWNNKALVYATSTFRYLKCAIGFVTPSWGFIDKRLRILASYWMYTTLHDQNNERYANIYFYKLKTDLFGEKIFFQRLRFYDAVNKKVVIAKKYKVHRLREDLRKQLDDKMRLFKQNVRKELIIENDRIDRTLEKTENKISLQDYALKAGEFPEVKEDLIRDGRVSHVRLMEKFPELNREYARDVSGILNLRWRGKR